MLGSFRTRLDSLYPIYLELPPRSRSKTGSTIPLDTANLKVKDIAVNN
jgi:hypothetical protein